MGERRHHKLLGDTPKTNIANRNFVVYVLTILFTQQRYSPKDQARLK
jgi:hypothetical protein